MPLQRPQRLRKASQRAASVAPRVAKRTNNTTRAAVTQALLAPATPAAAPTAPISEVVVAPAAEAPTAEAPAAEVAVPAVTPMDVVQKRIDPPPAHRELTPFTYSLAWSVTDEGHGQHLKQELLRQQSNIGVESFTKVESMNKD
jgi:cytoskeletal protein RodZ